MLRTLMLIWLPSLKAGIMTLIFKSSRLPHEAHEVELVLSEEMTKVGARSELEGALNTYRNRRLTRSAAVQGLSRFASDIIIRGFDTPAKIVDGRLENFNYAGIVTRLLQPILPIFFMVQFNFLYEGWRNEFAFDVKAGLLIGGLFVCVLDCLLV